MALHWKDAISFVLDEQLAVKRLKFNDVLSEQADDRRAESAAEEFDASFAIMALAVRDFIAELLAALGGKRRLISSNAKPTGASGVWFIFLQ